MAADKSLSKTELLTRLQRVKTTMANVKEQASEISTRVVSSTLSIGGGAASGMLRGWNEDGTAVEVPGTDIPADAAIAAGLLVLGISGMADKASDSITALGAGMGAAAAAFQVKEMVSKARREA